jgi:hypothetical protein
MWLILGHFSPPKKNLALYMLHCLLICCQDVKICRKTRKQKHQGGGRGGLILFACLGFNSKLAILNLQTDTYNKYFQKNFLLPIKG